MEEKEIDKLVDEVNEDMEACKEILAETSQEKTEADEKETARATDIRYSAEESLSETRKRRSNSSGGEDDLSPRQMRRSAPDTMRYLEERSEQSREQHSEAIKVRNTELELRSGGNTYNTMTQILKTLAANQQQTQKQMALQQQKCNNKIFCSQLCLKS